MAYVPLQTLIDKQDSFEIVRDQIGAILVNEIANQKTLASADAQDPNDYDLQIYLERSNPWERWLNVDPETVDPADITPIVNVWYESDTSDPRASDTIERQKIIAMFNIDCYGYGFSQDDGATGHLAGDKLASFECQKALRLVRNILMAGPNAYLQMRGFVWHRWHRSRTIYQPQTDESSVQKIVGGRFTLEVHFSEFSPQYEGQECEYIAIDFKQSSDGKLIAEVDFDLS